jgi:hypothetical protein
LVQSDPFIGHLIGGRFEVKKKIGQGGMAAVYGAVDVPTGRLVALKILPRDLLSQPEYVQRFLREAQSIKNIQHPNVIRIFGMGKDGDLPFYAMEYLPYPDLEGYLKRQGKLPLNEVLELTIGLMKGLEVTHARGLFHRDIKPANVVIAPEHRAILVDFGLVKDTNRTQLTATGAVMGTPLYMSPELLQGALAEAPSDIYQVGLLVFEMISGKRTHAGDSMVQVAHKVMVGDYEPIETFVPDLDEGWLHLIHNMLGNELADRYRDTTEVIRDLERIRQGKMVEALVAPEKTLAMANAATEAFGKGPPTTALSSGVPLSGLGSSAPPKDAPYPRKVLLAFFLAMVVVVSLVVDFRGDFLPREVVVHPGLTGFLVTWKTQDPCSSGVQVRARYQETWETFSPEEKENEKVREHRVDVAGFHQGDHLEFRITSPEDAPYPSREVDLQQFRVRKLHLEEIRSEAVAVHGKAQQKKRTHPHYRIRGPLRLSFETSIKAECIFLSDGKGGEHEFLGASADGLHHQVEIPLPSHLWRHPRLVATTLGGDLVEEDLLGPLSSRVDALVGLFSEVNLIKIAREMPPEDILPTEADRIKWMKAAIARAEGYEHLAEIYLFGPWVLSSQAVASRTRQRVYQVMDDAFRLAWFAGKEDVDFLSDEVPLYWGDFSEGDQSSLKGSVESVILDLGQKDTFGPILGVRDREVEFFLEKRCAPEAMVEVELVVDGRLNDEVGLELTFNEGVPLSIYGRRLALEQGTHFFHGFPASMLRKGKNRLRIASMNMFDQATANTIRILKLTVRLPAGEGS